MDQMPEHPTVFNLFFQDHMKKGYAAIDETTKHPVLQGSGLTVVTENYLAKNPQFPKLWNDLRTKAVKEIRENSEKFFRFYAEASGYPVDVVKVSFKIEQWTVESSTPDGLKLIEETKEFLVEQALAKKDFVITDWLAK